MQDYRPEGFWSDTYHGHNIAILNHGGRWLVYLDHVLQNRMLFESAEAAESWLQHKVDRRHRRAPTCNQVWPAGPGGNTLALQQLAHRSPALQPAIWQAPRQYDGRVLAVRRAA